MSNRKNFLLSTAGSLSGLFFLPALLKAQRPWQPNIIHPVSGGSLTNPAPTENSTEPEPYKMEWVKDFVVAGHGNLDKVRSMLAEHPNLQFSKYDWGNGDFEAAIEGAGHVGNKDIANFLIDSGSRVTLFVLTMLGRTDLVKPILEAYPKLIFANGPHGFTLLHHAKVGGKEGEELYNYLWEHGLKDTWVKIK